MARHPRIPAAKQRELIAENVRKGAVAPFQAILATGLYHAPKPKAWREIAKDPNKYSQAIKNLAPLAGYVERKESVNMNMSLPQLAEMAIARHGIEQARDIWKAHGMPMSAFPDSPINGELADPVPEPA